MNLSRRRKVISFDGDNTLWDWDGAMRIALRSVVKDLRESGAADHSVDVERLMTIRVQVGVEMGDGLASLLDMRRESLRRGIVEAGLDGSDGMVDSALETFILSRDRALKLFAEVLEPLKALREEGWTNVLLTNGNGNPKHTGIAPFLDHLLYAEEIGARKPEAAAFQSVCEATGCDISDLIHVGDSLDNDVLGAEAAGATAVWLNRHDAASPAGIQPRFEIRTMSELHSIITNKLTHS